MHELRQHHGPRRRLLRLRDLRGDGRLRLIVAATLAGLLGLACATPGLKDGGAIGALGGGLIGAAVDSDDRRGGALLGAALGAVLGAVIGSRLADPDADGPDRDGDEVSDVQDNCPDTPNKEQQDVDGDGRGDACDPDSR